MSDYRVCIDQTVDTITNRAKYYRNLIIAVTFISLISIGLAIIVWSWTPISGFFFLFPTIGLYFFLDSKLLLFWRSQLLESWTKGKIDICALSGSVSAIPNLPKETLQSMFATLPPAEDLVIEQEISSSTRKAIAVFINTIHTCRSDSLAFKTLIYTIIGVSLTICIALWRWQPLFGIISILPVLLVKKWVKIRRLKEAHEKSLAAKKLSEFNHEKYLEIVCQIPYKSLTMTEKERFIIF